MAIKQSYFRFRHLVNFEIFPIVPNDEYWVGINLACCVRVFIVDRIGFSWQGDCGARSDVLVWGDFAVILRRGAGCQS